MQTTTHVPCRELRAILLPAYRPCEGFQSGCGAMCWDPARGHVPRGFRGAAGHLTDIRLVLVVAEPGDPHPDERYDADAAPDELLVAVCEHVSSSLITGRDQFHQNLKDILRACCPGVPFDEQMRRTWITNSVLCSAAREGGTVPAAVERRCGELYLSKQLALLPQATVIALGRKAQARLKRLGVRFIPAASVAPPGCNRQGARQSWERAAELARRRIT